LRWRDEQFERGTLAFGWAEDAVDKSRNSAAVDKYAELVYKYLEWRPSKSVLLRLLSDVRIMFEPEKK